jgi:hypothetical protein
MSKRARPNEPLADWCEAALQGCTGRASQRHHVLRRSRGGTDEAANTRDLCWHCHQWVHANPASSYELGLLQRGTK